MTQKVSKLNASMRQGSAALLLLAVAGVPFVTQAVAAPVPYRLELRKELNVGELHVPVGTSQIINSPKPLKQIIIGNPNIGDIKLLSSQEVLILGKSPGSTNLAFRDRNNQIIAFVDLVVGYDLEAIKRKLHELLPAEEGIEVRSANDTVLLTGQVSNLAAMDKAVSIARSYVGGGQGKESDKLVNLLQIGGGQQVMLEVTVAELDRTARKGLGVDTEIGQGDFGLITGPGNIDSSRFPSSQLSPDGSGLILPDKGTFDNVVNSAILNVGGATTFGGAELATSFLFDTFNLQVSALEQQGLAKVLAEPKLITLSGQEASFLAGGEFPVPAAQSSSGAGGTTAITVEFKEFGVGVKFTPTVLSSKHISLKLATEVSDLDEASGTAISGIVIPGVSTRRASTTVELGDGESFMIAGLLKEDMGNVVNQFPGLGDIPVLGALFRSTGFQRQETELVMAVTPRLVKPVPNGSLALPTDGVLPPSDVDQYLWGNLEGSPPGGAPAEAERSSGVEGSYGHQL